MRIMNMMVVKQTPLRTCSIVATCFVNFVWNVIRRSTGYGHSSGFLLPAAIEWHTIRTHSISDLMRYNAMPNWVMNIKGWINWHIRNCRVPLVVKFCYVLKFEYIGLSWKKWMVAVRTFYEAMTASTLGILCNTVRRQLRLGFANQGSFF